MKQFFSSVLVAVASVTLSFSYAQQKLDVKALPADWHLYSSQNGVNIFVKSFDYNYNPAMKPASFALVKVENTTRKPLTLSYAAVLSDDQGCINCGTSENVKTVQVAAEQTLEGTPEMSGLSFLVTNPNFTAPREPKFIQLSNIKLK